MSTNRSITRDDLKKYFQKGEIPMEEHYNFLIDSMINKLDDGFDKDERNGLMLAATDNGRFISFYEKIADLLPFLTLTKDEDSLKLSSVPASGTEEVPPGIFFYRNGSLSIGKQGTSNCRLDVEGFAGMEGRTGTFLQGLVPADGKWHSIVKGLDNCNAYEVVARVGKVKSGRFAIMHAIAMRAFGRGRGGIRRTGSHLGLFWNKLKLRWRHNGDHSYELQIKTGSNYSEGIKIYYHIAKLWDDKAFLPNDKTFYY